MSTNGRAVRPGHTPHQRLRRFLPHRHRQAPRSTILGAILALIAALLALTVPAAADPPGAPVIPAAPTGNVTVDPAWKPSGLIGGSVSSAVVRADDKVLIGGSFEVVGGAPHRGVALLNADGSVDHGFAASTDGPVNAVVVQPDGRILIGGLFTTVNGVSRRGIARLTANGQLDTSFDPGSGLEGKWPHSVGVQAWAIVLTSEGRVVVGGEFLKAAGAPRSNIARFMSDGTLDVGFDPGTGFDDGISGAVYDVAQQSDGRLLVVGDFETYNDVARRYVARLNTNGSLDAAFNPGAGVSGGDHEFVWNAVIQPDGKSVLSGDFNQVAGLERHGLVRLDPSGAVDPTFDAGAGAASPFRSLVLQQDGRLLVGNSPTVIRLLSSGAIDPTFTFGGATPGSIQTTGATPLTVTPTGAVLVSGRLSVAGTSLRIVRLDSSGELDPSFAPLIGKGVGTDGSIVDVVVQPDGKTVAAGDYGDVNGTARPGIARFNADGTLDGSFDPGLGPTSPWPRISAIGLQSDGRLLVVGAFTQWNGVDRVGIVRLNANGSLDDTFNPGSGFTGSSGEASYPSVVEVQADGRIVVAGLFRAFNGIPRGGLARIHADGTLDQGFDSGRGVQGSIGEPGSVYAMQVQRDGKILIGGYFSSYGGVARRNVARVEPSGSLDNSFDPAVGPDRPVWSIGSAPDGRVYIGGEFTTFGGLPRSGIVRLGPDGGVDPGFLPGGGIESSHARRSVRALEAMSDGAVLIGGFFERFDGVPRSAIARVLPTGALDTSFDPGIGFLAATPWSVEPASVTALEFLPDGRIVVGGVFAGFNDGFPPPANVTRLLPTVVAPGVPSGLSVTNGDGAALVGFTGPASHGGAPVTNYEYSVDGGGWTARVPASAQPAVTVPGLMNGQTYQVRVRAVNAAGPGAASAAVTVVPVAPTASRFVSITPARTVDTRVSSGGAGPLAPGETRTMAVTTPVGGGSRVVPPGAVAVAYNVTVPGSAGGGHVRVMPGDAVGLPGASAINFRAGETIANAATVRIDAAGAVKVYNGAGVPVDVIIDVSGYFVAQVDGAAVSAAAGARAVVPANGAGGLFTAVTPVRVYDTAADPAGMLPADASRLVSTATTQDGSTAVVPAGASAVAYNITVTDTAGGGHLRAFPTGAPLTATSVLNWSRSGERIANGAVVQVDDRGRFTVYNGSGAPVRFFVDVTGYYSATGQAFYPIDPVRTTETRYTLGGAGPIGPVAPGQRSVSTATSAAGGFPVVPAGASAAAYNATVVATGSAGHLRVYPTGAPLVGASALNWPGAGYTRANASIVAVSGNREVSLYNGASTPTDVLIDVNGYYK